MLDIKLVRENPEVFEKKIRSKVPDASVYPSLELDKRLREAKTEVERLKAEKNRVSQEIGKLKRNGEDASDLMTQVSSHSDEINKLDHLVSELEEQFIEDFSALPNVPSDDIPVSQEIKDNVCLKEVGEKSSFSFPFKNHLELNEKLDILDFKRGAKMSGTGFPVYKGLGARLEWALLSYMLQIHIKNGFEQWMMPHLVRPEMMYGVGQLPKFESQLFKIKDDDYQLYLIPTAEAPLNSLYFDEILDFSELPKKLTAYSPCFRREAGAAGSQERGLIRVHQFNKVELFCFSLPEESDRLFDEMIASAEEVLEGLGLHYRNMLLVTGDMSFGSAKTVDIEVWLPGQDRYYEVSSVSNCTDYQARRAKIRFRRGPQEKPEFLHTLNGSGVATSRLMVALLENNQNSDGSVNIPKVLQPYLDGLETIPCIN